MKKLIILFVLLCTVPLQAMISVENGTTNWTFVLQYQLINKNFTRILAPKDIAFLGSKSQVSSVTLTPIGTTNAYTVNLSPAQKTTMQSFTFLIQDEWYGASWDVKNMPGYNIESRIVAKALSIKNPLDAFPLAAKKSAGKYPWWDILGLKEGALTKSNVKNAYHDLSNQWNSALQKVTSDEVKNKIKQVLDLLATAYQSGNQYAVGE